MPDSSNGETPHADGAALDAMVRNILNPPALPPGVNRGHFALLNGKLVAQQMFIELVALQDLAEDQRLSLDVSLKRAIELTEFRIEEMRRIGKDRESLAHAEGCLRGFRNLQKIVGDRRGF